MTPSPKPPAGAAVESRPHTQLAWPDIRNSATAFARAWKDERSEREEAQAFWIGFFEVFGVNRPPTGVHFEKAAQRFAKPGMGRIDVFWPGTLLAEHKSEGQDLDAAYAQATDYFDGLSDDELPDYIIVSDFRRFRVYDLSDHTHVEFALLRINRQLDRETFIIFEARGAKEDQALELEFRRVCDGVNRFKRPLSLHILVADKRTNSEGLQLADLTARPIGLNILRPAQANRAWDVLQAKFFTGDHNCVTGNGLKTFSLESKRAPGRSQEPSAGRVVPTHFEANRMPN